MHKAAFVLFFLVSGLIFGNTTLAQEPLHSVKFKLFNNKIFFTAKILDSNEIEVLFDAGTYAYMHSGTAQKHRIDYTETGKLRTTEKTKEINVFEKFPVSFPGFTDTFETVRSQATAPYKNKRVDMVFGKEWIDRYIVQIDYDASLIHLFPIKGFEIPDGYTEVKTIGWNRYPLVKSTFKLDNGDSVDVNVELNVGSEVGFQIDKYLTRQLKLVKIQRDRGHMRLFGPDGKGIEGMLTRMPSVRIDNMRVTNVRGAVFEDGYSSKNGEFVQGIVGQDFLKWYNLIFDKWGGKVYYAPKKQE